MGRGFLLGLMMSVLAFWAAPAIASANHIPLAPECSDMHDNDGDGTHDFPGDSNCNSPVDDSEGNTGGGGSDIFVTFVTQWDNGSGGAADVVCEHEVLVQPGTPIDSLLLMPVDVNSAGCGGAPDVSMGVRIPLSLDTKKPTIKVNRLGGGTLPLRVEVVQVDAEAPARRETFGYDALESSAPSTYSTALDLTDIDDNGQTLNAVVTQTVTGPGSQLALVTDNFRPGNTLAERNDLSQNRVNFRDSGGTQVPSQVAATLFVGTGRQEIQLSRNQPTVMDFLISKPGDDPKVSGTLDRLPPNASVKVTDVDTDDPDTIPDKKTIIYDADEPVNYASVAVETVRRLPRERPPLSPNRVRRPDTCELIQCGPKKRLRLTSYVSGLPGLPDSPEDAKLVYMANDDTIDFDGSARIPGAGVIALDEAPLFGRAKWMSVGLGDVPRHLHADLSRDNLEFSTTSDDGIGFTVFDAAQEPPQFPIICFEGSPLCQDRVYMTDTANIYNLGARIHRLKSANIRLEPDIDVRLDTAPEMVPPGNCRGPIICRSKRGPDLVPVWRTPFNVSLNLPRKPGDYAQGQQGITGKIAPLKPVTRFQLGNSNGTVISYSDEAEGAGSGPDITLDGSDMPSLPKGSAGQQATQLHVKLQNLPRRLEFSTGKDGFPLSLDASGEDDSVLDKLEVQMTSGPDNRLPEDECMGPSCENYLRYDGLLLEDLADRFVVYARMRGLRRLFVHKIKVGETDALAGRLDSNAFGDGDLALKLDVSKQKGAGTIHSRIESIDTVLDNLPKQVNFDSVVGPDLTTLDYRASAQAGFLDYAAQTHFTGDGQSFRDRFQELNITPLPERLRICRAGKSDFCTDDIISTNREADNGSLLISAPRRIDFHYSTQDPGNVFTVADLNLRQFALQADSQKNDDDGGSGYLAFDTLWDAPQSGTVVDPSNSQNRHTHPAPPEDQAVDGAIRVVNGTNNITDFDFGDGLFAAQNRFMIWHTTKQLYFGCTPFGCIERVGHAFCPSGIDFYIARPASSIPQNIVEGDTVEFDLQAKLCNTFPKNTGTIVPGVD